ncbi:MAG: ABC transporter substrate-binding protein [Phycisphaerae bacterium]|nr:ABC transporter substrate-binding protein [Phycisphaerae bacterium]
MKMNPRTDHVRRTFLAGMLAAGAMLFSSASANAEEGPILIGHYASMTGKEATFGQSTDRGIRLAVKEINEAGGLHGRKLELKTYDDKGESQEAGKAVTRLITDDKVVAVLGEVASSLSLAGGAVCQQFGVPMISPSSTNPRVTIGRDMVSRVCFTDDQQAAALAVFTKENLKKTRVAILFDQTQAYSKGLKDDFVKSFKKLGGEIVSEQAYSGGDQDFSAQLTTIRAAKPEVLLIPGYYTDGGNIAIQARKLGIGKDIPLLGGDGWDSEQLGKIGGADIEGAYYSNHSAPDQPGGNVSQFIEKFKAEYGGQVPDALTGLGYDACMVLFDAMKRCHAATGGLKGKDLAKAIAETKGYPGVTGTITIDKNRNAQKPIVMVQLKNGVPTWVANVDAKIE